MATMTIHFFSSFLNLTVENSYKGNEKTHTLFDEIIHLTAEMLLLKSFKTQPFFKNDVLTVLSNKISAVFKSAV